MFTKPYRKHHSTQRKTKQTQNSGCTLGCVTGLLTIPVASISLLFKMITAVVLGFAELTSRFVAVLHTTQEIMPHSDTNGVVTRSLVPPQYHHATMTARTLPSKEEGYVYILTNPSMPGLIKIGMTKNSPKQRAIELSRGTNVPAPYRLEAYALVSNRHFVERELHRLFARQRMNAKREFFAVPVPEAKEALKKLAYIYPPSISVPLSPIRQSSPPTSEPRALSQSQPKGWRYAPPTSNSLHEESVGRLINQALVQGFLLLIGGIFLCGVISALAK